MTKRFNYLTICFSIFFPSFAGAVSLNFSPIVELLETKQESLVLSYLEPCGSKFHSVLLQELDSEIRIAVVLQQENTICTALPKKKTVSLAQFHWQSQKKLTFISPFLGKGRLQIAATQDLKQEVNGQRSLYFQTSCADFLGIIVQPGNADTLKVGVMQFVEKNAADKGCARKLEFTSIELLKLYPTNMITLLNQVSSKKYESSLELFPVKVSANSANEITLSTEIPCGQQVVGAAIRENSVGTLSVGALVMRRSEKGKPCVKDAMRWELNLSGLEPLQNRKLISLPSGLTLNEWRMVSPILRFKKKQGFALEREQSDACDQRSELDFQVYGVDDIGTVALGVLTKSDRLACYDSGVAAKQYQPTLFVRQDKNLSLVPMTLIGLN